MHQQVENNEADENVSCPGRKSRVYQSNCVKDCDESQDVSNVSEREVKEIEDRPVPACWVWPKESANRLKDDKSGDDDS